MSRKSRYMQWALALVMATAWFGFEGGSLWAGEGIHLEEEEIRRPATPAPSLSQVPEGAAWSITPADSSRAYDLESVGIPEGVFSQQQSARRVIHRYSGGIRHILVDTTANDRVELYLTAGSVLIRKPGARRILALPATLPSARRLSNRPGMFHELSWVGPEFLVGEIEYEERWCRAYQQFPAPHSPDAAPPSESDDDDEVHGSTSERFVPRSMARDGARAVRTALIDAETGLPVALEDQGVLWNYQFSSRQEEFSLPNEFAEALEELAKSRVDIPRRYRSPQ